MNTTTIANIGWGFSILTMLTIAIVGVSAITIAMLVITLLLVGVAAYMRVRHV